MELELAPLNLPSDNERPFVIAGPCSAETEEKAATTFALVSGNPVRNQVASRAMVSLRSYGSLR